MKSVAKLDSRRITKFATFQQRRNTNGSMPNSTALPDNGGQNTKSKPAQAASKLGKWDVLNLTSTWFLANDGTPVIVDGSLPGGATDAQWIELISRTPVRVSLDRLNRHWGQYARCAFLNWCEEHLPEEKRPTLFASREEAVASLEKISKDFDSSKRIEISTDSTLAQEPDGGQA